MVCECGSQVFYALQICYHDIEVNECGDFIKDIGISEADKPHGPYICVICSKTYKEMV